MAPDFRPKRHRCFSLYKKAKKYEKFKMLKNAGPKLNLETDKMGHLVFMGQSDSKLFSLPN